MTITTEIKKNGCPDCGHDIELVFHNYGEYGTASFLMKEHCLNNGCDFAWERADGDHEDYAEKVENCGQIPCNNPKGCNMHNAIDFHCPECDFTTSWDKADMLAKGLPMCPECDIDLQ